MSLLVLGQIHDSRTPNAAAAELWYLSTSYGNPVGTAGPLNILTPPEAPAGMERTMTFRGLLALFQYEGSCTIRLTPIIDLQTELAAVTRSISAPTSRRTGRIYAPFAEKGTWIQARLEVIETSGRVAFLRAWGLRNPNETASVLAGDDLV